MKKSTHTQSRPDLDTIMQEGLDLMLKSCASKKKSCEHIDGLNAMKIMVMYDFAKFMKEMKDNESYEFIKKAIIRDYNSLKYKTFKNYLLRSCPEIINIVQ